MPNSNVISKMQGGNSPTQGANAIPSLSLTSNTETLFTVQSGGTAVLTPQPAGQLLAASAAPSFGTGFDGLAFKVRATFKVTTGGVSTAIIALYVNQTTSATINGTKVATITSQSLSTASASGYLEYYGIWDSVSTKLNGTQLGAFGTQVVSSTVGTSTNVAIAALANLTFSLSANLGSGVAATFTVGDFVVETV